MTRVFQPGIYTHLFLAATTASFTTAGRAQNTNSAPATAAKTVRTLTLDYAKQLAFDNNWDLLAARSDVDIATAQKILARQFPNPALSLSTAKINVDDHPSSTPGGNDLWRRSYDTIAAINQLFEIGGKRSSRQASAQAGFKAAAARLEDARRVLDQAVTKAYVAAVLAGADAQILRASSASLRKEAGIAETRLKAGDISKADQSQIEIAADRLELDARTAETTAASARVAVEVLLGTNHPRGDWAPGDTLDTLAGLPFLASEVTPGAARPDLLAAESTLAKAEADLKLQKAQRIPDPTIFAQYEHEPPDQPNTVGFGLSLPLPLWNRNQGGIRAAQAAQEQAAVQVAKLKAQIAADISIAQFAYGDASERWRRQREEIEPKSADIRKTVTFAYEKGGASLLDLLSAERNDNEIRLATAQAAADTATAVANLKAALNLKELRTNQGKK